MKIIELAAAVFVTAVMIVWIITMLSIGVIYECQYYLFPFLRAHGLWS